MEFEKLKYSATIDKSTFEVLNSEFTKAKAYILYYGDNNNKSRMSKEAVELALPSLYNTPVVAEYIEKKEDFGTHGGKLVISDEGIEYVQTTKPYGLVPESADPRWEMVDDKEYLVADIILWSGRYSELEKTIEEFSNQSMEINVMEGSWLEAENIYDISKFEFSALCILGQSVNPCFEKAKIIAYGLDEFKQETDEMFKKYKEFAAEVEDEIPAEEPKDNEESDDNQKEESEPKEEFKTDISDGEEESKEQPEKQYSIEEYQKLQDEKDLIQAEFEALKLKVTEFESTIFEKDALITQLNEYKNKNEYEIVKFDIESLIEEFEVALKDSEEFKALKDSVNSSFEKGEIFIELDVLEKELFAMVGRMKYKLKTEKPKKQNFSRVVIDDETIIPGKAGVYGSAEKYIQK